MGNHERCKHVLFLRLRKSLYQFILITDNDIVLRRHQLLGVNIFTYLLAALITIFLSLNFLLGPGWLGSALGITGTGSIDEVSDSLPKIIDLSNSDYLL
jgi:hypothetical protein